MTRWILVGAIVLASAILSLGYAWGGWLIGMVPLAAWGVCWLVGLWRGWDWVGSAGLVLFVLSAAVGFVLHFEFDWMLVGLVAALVCWDLDHFGRRLRDVDEAQRPGLERAHLLRLAPPVLAGLVLGEAALLVRTRLGFGLALLLGLLLVVGLSQAVGPMIRRV
jgi:amino acid transporter